METVKVDKTVDRDGELHLTDLPCRKGDLVEAVLTIQHRHTPESRAAALREFHEHVKAHSFRSTMPYPTREEMHERD